MEEPCLPKSKSYLKIISIPFYPHENFQERLTSNDIEMILKQNQIFDNISLASKPRVIKVSPKSDISIVWIDIWDVQSGSNAKMLINKCFNIGRYIATIQGANINPGVLQCKNCWKWGHCHMQVHLSRKLHPHGDATSEPYKPAFHSSHLSRNTSYGGAATLRVFRLPQQRYSYSTQSSITELLLSVSQHWNLCLGQ